jgi:hypothetical protein
MTIREFWRSTSGVSGSALVCAAFAGALNVASYAGLTMGVFVVVHLAVMAVGLFTFHRVAVHHSLAWRAGGVHLETTPLPRQLVWGAVAAFLYLASLILFLPAVYPEGYPEIRDGREVWVQDGSVVRELAPGSVATFKSRELRLFSAVWLCLALGFSLGAYRSEERIALYKALRESPK